MQKFWWRQTDCKTLFSNGYVVQNVRGKEKNPDDVSYFMYFHRINNNFQVFEEISGNKEAEVFKTYE